MGKLLTRTLSGLVYVAIIVGCILWGNYPFSCMASLFGAVAVIEFEKITRGLDRKMLPVIALDVAAVMLMPFFGLWIPIFIWILVVIARFTIELYLKSDTPLPNLERSAFTMIYIGMPLSAMTFIGLTTNLHLVMAIFIMIWLNDTGAFVTGSLFGRHRLFERISPKKSWEGFWGGFVFNLVAAYIFCEYCSDYFGFGSDVYKWLGLGAIVSVFSTWGDLVESMIKRSLHIKDSGNIIPGHGGILDRIDSLLFVMPVTFVYFILLAL